MTSSLISGEQRWASKRRGGMTVLGKVVVPKPLNLPSQRLENRGLDNVEIVPKGTLSWGSKSSSACSNAWGTSALSPSTDGGGSSSPSHLVGRPLSSSGTRPSTAGSEKAHDSNVNSCGPNSTPSSASGVLGSTHTSLTSLRPRSAETRPGSSHLSRFAEPSPEGSKALGATASSERMGASEGFSLISGDFPTLGSEKDESRRNLGPLDASHGQPGSSSGGAKSMSESMESPHDVIDSDSKGLSRRTDCPPFLEDGPRPSMDRWHGDPHLYQNPNIGPPHYDSWRGAPSANPPGGVWYRGPLGPPPYGGPVPPRGFHMDPFPYYRPQVPAPVLANSQSIPPPGLGHHGHHPQNGDMYRPYIPESFMRPGAPLRPGFYPVPLPCEGYYRPPMGFCNPDERDFHFRGMTAGPPIYNRPINQNASDLNNSHPRSFEGRGPDKIDHTLLHDRRGNHQVSMKPNDRWNQNDKEKWGHRVTTDGSNHEKGILSNVTLQENARDDYNTSNSLDYGESTAKDEVPSRPRYNRFHSISPDNSKLSESFGNVEELGTGPSTDDLTPSSDQSLIQKIQGLSVKARASGESRDAFDEEELTEVQGYNAWAHPSVDEVDTEVVLERHYPTGVLVPVSRDSNVVLSDAGGESVMTTLPRRPVPGAQSIGNLHVKGNFDGQEASGWGGKSQSHSVRSADSIITAYDHNSAVQPSEVWKPNFEMKGDGESDAQRAKTREIAKQRAVQRQKEEEERIREQKAKALAKLKELNRRSGTQGLEVPSKKEIVPPHFVGPLKLDVPIDQPDLEPNSNAGSSSVIPDNVALINENGASKVVDSMSSQIQSPTDNVYSEDAAGNRTAPQVHDVSKHKRVDFKPTQNIPLENKPSPISIMIGQIDVLKDHRGDYAKQEVTVGSKVDGKGLPETPAVSDSPVPHKRRNNKSGKNKQKVEDSLNVVSSTVSPNNSDIGQANSGSVKDNASHQRTSSTSVQLSTDAKEPSHALVDHSSLSREDVRGRVNSSWKGQHSRKPRSSQGNRLSEKAQTNDAVVWAPVRSHNKVEITDQNCRTAGEPLVSSESMPHISSKTRRAEMERYIPRPVAKELAQQGSIQQSPPLLVDHSPTSHASRKSSSGTGGREKASQGSDSVAKVGPLVEVKNRHARDQGSWGQRVSTLSNASQASQYSSAGSTNKNVQSMEPPNKPTELSMRGSEAVMSDGWSIVNDSSFKSSSTFTDVKDQLPLEGDKSHPFKGKKGGGSSQNFDCEVSNATEINHVDKTLSSKENRAVMDRSAHHWQPKSQLRNKFHGGQNHMDQDMGLNLDIGSGSGLHTQSQYNQSEDDKTMQDMGHQETKRGKRGPHVKGHPHPPSEVLETEVEQRPSSGYHEKSNYGGRSNMVHESRGDRGATAPESSQHYSSVNTERQRQNSYYEYQPVGQYDSNESGPQTENQHGGSKFRERGYSRRGKGNFHGRLIGNE